MSFILGKKTLLNYLVYIVSIIIILYVLNAFLHGFWLMLFLLLGINIILAISLTITNSWINFFSVGHGGIMLAGAYAAALLTMPPYLKKDVLGLQLPLFILNLQIPFLPALIIGGIVGTIFGVFLVLPSLRLRGFYFCTGTLGFSFIMTTIAENMPNITNGAMGLRQFPAYTNVWWVWGIAILAIYIALRIKRSYIGRALIAVGKDQDLAEHIGINLLKYKTIAFCLSSFFAALAGVLWVHLILNLFPRAFTLNLIFQIVAMIVIGGMGSISGAVIGAVIITFFSHLLSPLEEGFSFLGIAFPRMLGITTILVGILLIAVLIFKREGIMGENEFSIKLIRNWVRRKRLH
jgi:branched-chain amino acid transport system permease protein